MGNRPLRQPPALIGVSETEAMLRRLVQVPKEEVLAEERKYEAMRKRLRDKKERKPKSDK